MIEGTQGQDEILQPIKKTISLKLISSLLLIPLIGYFIQPAISQWYSSIPSVASKNLIIAPVIKGDLIRDVAVSGKVVAANAPQLYSTEVGQITLLAKPGEAVKKHQIVAQLTSPELDSMISQQQSTLEQRKIDASRGALEDKEAQLDLERTMNSSLSVLNVAKRENQRAELSFEKQVMSEVDLMKSRDALNDADIAYVHAQKRVELAKERLAFESQNRQFLVQKQQLILDELVRRQSALAIAAPVSGIVGNWLVAQKNTVPANTPVMTIVDLSQYEAELYVPEFYADDLGIGLVVSIKIAGASLFGEVIAISPEIDDNQVQVRAKLLSSESIKLRQNQRLNARIEFEKKEDVLMVKRGAFLGSHGGKSAYRLSTENTAGQINITIGTNSVDYVEVLSGVNEGDQLIISDYTEFNSSPVIYITN